LFTEIYFAFKSTLHIYTRRASRFNKTKVIASVLNADEKRVVKILAASDGNALQKHVVKESGFSKAKVSRLLKSMGWRGIIKLEPVSGRENRVLLVTGKEKRSKGRIVHVEKMPSAKKLKAHDRVIIDALWRAQRPLTTKQISERGGMTWITARKHLENMSRHKCISKHVGTNRIYWRLK